MHVVDIKIITLIQAKYWNSNLKTFDTPQTLNQIPFDSLVFLKDD
jgi:hypothetical protein